MFLGSVHEGDRLRMDGKQAETLFGAALAACLGGVVHWLRFPKGGYTILAFFISISTAAFMGMQAHFLLTWLGYDESLQFAVSGLAGYGGGALLDAAVPFLVRLAYKKAGLDFPHPGLYTTDRDSEGGRDEDEAK